MSDDRLSEYRNKRNLEKTSEPRGESITEHDKPVFVFQKHDASNHHYDFRIENQGVLKSWAVPKGPSTDPSVKRLAIPTEDHPLKYADFEGIIPEGKYGAGTVMIWDNGTYKNISEKDGRKLSITEAISAGHLSVRLKGKKLKGGYTLVRTGRGENDRWLFIKMRDKYADEQRNPVKDSPASSVSGKTMEQIYKADPK